MKTPPHSNDRSAKIRPLLLASIVANALLLAGVGYYFLAPKANKPGGYGSGGGSVNNLAQQPPAAGTVEALGRLQPSGGLISVFGPPGDKIVKFNVAVGESVAEDRVLALLAGEDKRKLMLATLDAKIKEAEQLRKAIEASRDAKLADIDAEAKQSLAGIEQDLAIIDAKIRVVDAQKARAEMELKRLTEAKTEGVNVSEQEFEALRIQLVMADGEKAGSTAQKEKIVIQKEQSAKSIEAKKASLKAETDRALAMVPGESLQTERTSAERDLQDGQLRAPTAGRVLRLLSKPGDTISPTQPVLQLANTTKMSVLAEVYETDVGRLREWLRKAPVSAVIDGRALGAGDKGELHGTVSGPAKISTVIARNAITPLGPREDADRRVVEVEVELDAASSKAAETFIGLQVRVRFEATQMTPIRLALVNLFHDRKRTAVSVIGAAFAVVLVFMQLGFLGSVENTATLFYDKLQYDVMILSSEYIDMSRPGRIDRIRLAQARSAAGVRDVQAVSLGGGLWRNPTDDPIKGKRKWQISIVGIDPASMPKIFLPPGQGGIFADAEDEAREQAKLSRSGTVLLDAMSRPDFGDAALMPPGTKAEFNGQSVELAGYFCAGTGFSYTGLLITNEETFSNTVGIPSGKVTLGLVSIEPGQSADEVAENLRRILPPDTRVFTRSEMAAFERDYWVTRTAVGQFFYFGVLLALTVGSIFIYQMMVADIKKHLPEYATLKAMGYRFSYLFFLVASQAMVLAVLGYALGLIGSLGLYEVTKAAARLPIWMTYERMAIVLVLTVLMCVGSGLVAVRKVKNADPASLF